MRSNIKIRTIINIINVYNQYSSKVANSENKLNYYKSIGDDTQAMLAEIELNKNKTKLSEFLDYYV